MSLLNSALATVASGAIRCWLETLDVRVVYYDPTVDPALPLSEERNIYVFWHEYILLPLAFRGQCNLAMLVSRHRDAELLSRVARQMGFDFVRGSSNRGGAAALREILQRCRSMNLAITPDGPRGPRRELAAGPIYLSSKLGFPIVPLGLACHRPWRLKSWDRFAAPRPFSKARAVIGPQLRMPPDLNRDGIEHYRLVVQKHLNQLCDIADDWVESRIDFAKSFPVRRDAARRAMGMCNTNKPALELRSSEDLDAWMQGDQFDVETAA